MKGAFCSASTSRPHTLPPCWPSCLPVCLFICLSVYRSVCQPTAPPACLQPKIFTALELTVFSAGGSGQNSAGGLWSGSVRTYVYVAVTLGRVKACGRLVKAGNASPWHTEPLDWSIIILGTHPLLFNRLPLLRLLRFLAPPCSVVLSIFGLL